MRTRRREERKGRCEEKAGSRSFLSHSSRLASRSSRLRVRISKVFKHLIAHGSLVALIGCSSHLSTLPADPKPLAPTTLPAGTYLLWPQNTRITFVGTALMASHEGTFTRFMGQLACPDSVPQNARFTVEIDLDSVFTEVPLLTKHLKASDFFDVGKYPRATFVSTEVSTNSLVAPRYIIAGNLTLHGITKAISFPAQFKIDPAQISLDATITIHQDDFKMESARTTTNEVPVRVTVRIPRPPQAGL